MDRKYIETSVDELEHLMRESLRKRQVLGDLRDELTFRKTKRAKQLLREIEGLLAGDVRVPPAAPREARPEDQLDLID